MTHSDVILFLLGFLLPNNILVRLFRAIFPRKPLVLRREDDSPAKVNGFERFAIWCGDIFGSKYSFVFWIVVLCIWVAGGHFMHWSNTWQLLANTPTTWIELFAAILIQYVGNRIERRQEQNEKKMLDMEQNTLDMLEEIRNLSELMAANIEKPEIVVEELLPL